MTLEEEDRTLLMKEGDMWKEGDKIVKSYYNVNSVMWSKKRATKKEIQEKLDSGGIIYEPLKIMTFIERGSWRTRILIRPYRRVTLSEFQRNLTPNAKTYLPTLQETNNLGEKYIPRTGIPKKVITSNDNILHLEDDNCTMEIGGFLAECGARFWVIDYDYSDGTHYEVILRVD